MAPLIFISRPAANKTLPSVVDIAAFTFTSCPQHTTKFPWLAVIVWLILTFRDATKVSVVAALVPVTPFQVIGVFTLISPRPLPLVPVFAVVMVTSVAVRAVTSSETLILDEFAPGFGEKTPPVFVEPLSP
ncbi:MAG: hypothetical protein V9E91_02445 [Burkholderiaceae bacterium]